MFDLWVSLGFGVIILAAGLIGMAMRRFLPETHLDAGARHMITSVMGLVGLLLSLALGTLVGSGYTFFSTQKANIEQLCDRILLADNALAEFGPDAAWDRAGLRDYAVEAYRDIWIRNVDPTNYSLKPLLMKFREFDTQLANLQARTPVQVAALAAINGSLSPLEQTRLLMALQITSSISWPLLYILVSWGTMLFFCYGVLSQPNGTAIVAAVFGAFAVSSAIFLILELNQPFVGLFRIPPTTIEQTIAVIGK